MSQRVSNKTRFVSLRRFQDYIQKINRMIMIMSIFSKTKVTNGNSGRLYF